MHMRLCNQKAGAGMVVIPGTGTADTGTEAEAGITASAGVEAGTDTGAEAGMAHDLT